MWCVYTMSQGEHNAGRFVGSKVIKGVLLDETLSNIFYTSAIERSQHFQGPFGGPLVLTFCRPSQGN